MAASAPTEKVFRLHLSNEPTSLDPQRQKSAASSYLVQNLYRNIYIYDSDKGLVPDLGESCHRDSPTVLVCKLKKNLHWSDGSPLTSEDFLKSYRRLVDGKEAFPRADFLFKIKNAQAIYKGEMKPDNLGITAPDKTTLRFEFAEKNPDFEYDLANFVLAPVKNVLHAGQNPMELIVSGPYKISQWTAGQKIRLTRNDQYTGGNPRRPDVEFLFIAEDSVAFQLYQKKELNFLRRLPSEYIPEFKKREDFHWIPVLRFDYVGFGPSLKDLPKLREALALSLNYPELKKLFSSEGMPGCPGIPAEWTTKELCYSFDLTKAQKALHENTHPVPNLTLMYSTLGGDDHRRGTEWMQEQWSKNLSLKVQVQLRENKVYINELHENPPALFRKGVALDRPTCLAALETFASWNSENYIQLKDPAYEEVLKNLEKSSKPTERKKWCTEGVEYLLNHYYLVPTGRIHFAILADSSFQGWKLNAMNQLDLSGLKDKN